MRYLCALLVVTVTGRAAEVEPVRPAVCRAGGFDLIRFSNGVEIRAKGDAAFSVSFDAANYQGNARDTALRSAMARWNAAGSPWRYSFSGYTGSAPASSDGSMTIVHGGRSFPSGVLATTLISAYGSGELVDSDIFFNPTSNFSSDGSVIDFESVALHELGHGLGLDHNDGCNAAPTVMQSTIRSGDVIRALLAPEVEGVRFLYGGGGGSAGGGNSGNPPVLVAAPSALTFNGAAGGAVPAGQVAALSGTGGLAWTVTATAGWILLAPTAGALPAVLNVLVLPGGLAAGTHTGRITVTSGAGAREIGVTLSLSAPASFTLTPATLSFAAQAGGAAPASQTLSLGGTGGLVWTASVSPSGSWLRVSAGGGFLPASLAVSVVTAGLAPQVYTGRIVMAAGGISREATVQLTVSAQPALEVTPAQVTLAAPAGSTTPACAPVQAALSAGTGDFSAAPGATWLSATPAAGRLPGSVVVCANAANLAAGDYISAVTISTALAGAKTLTVRLTVSATVLIRDGGVRNAASFTADQPVTAGELLAIFGDNLCSTTAVAAAFPLPAELAGCRAVMGGIPARLLYVAPRQFNLIAPAVLGEMAGATTTLVIYNGGLASPAMRVRVAAQAPGIFTVLGTGAGAGAVTHADGPLVSRASPVADGEPIVVYLTGLGALTPALADGQPAPADPLARTAAPVRLLADGAEAAVLYAGAAPGFAGLQVVVATLPPALRRRFPEITVEVGGMPSNRVSAGGPSLLDVSPTEVRAGLPATVTLRGVNLAPGSALRIGAANLAGVLADGPLQTFRVTLPAAALASPGVVALDVVDAAAPAEAASNFLTLTIRP